MKKLKEPPLPVDVETWRQLTHVQKVKPLVLRWVEHGADSPPAVHIFYLLKIALYAVGGLLIISATPGLGSLAHFSSWWRQPIVFEKAIVWTMLVEALGFGGASGPLMFHFLPPVTAFLHWLRPGTIRLPPWPKVVPFTDGDRRTLFDVALYAAFIASAIIALLASGVGRPTPAATAGLMSKSVIIPMVALLGVLGLRDKVIYLAARAEVYWIPAIIFLFPYTQMLIGLKLALIFIWWGAGISKLTHIFPYVLTAMMSNAPLRPLWFKHAMYKNPTTDIRPSRFAFVLAHSGTVIELGLPFVLLFSHGGWLTLAAVSLMVFFHLNILSTIPLGVPNEWNVYMIFGTIWLFAGHAGVGVSDLHNPLLIALLAIGLAGPVLLGTFRPDLVSFLPGMRYYAGNWACSLWCFKTNADKKLREHIVKASDTMPEQLERLFSAEFAEVTAFKFRAFRSMVPQGRALNALLTRGLDNVDTYTVHDGEPLAGTLLGWNFGDGHLHNEQLLAAVQTRCQFAPGELVMIYLESQPAHRQRQHYRIVDAATGQLEEGYVQIKDLVSRQPWLDEDNPTVPLDVVNSTIAHDPDMPSHTRFDKFSSGRHG